MEPGWSPLDSDPNPYLQVDFLQPTFITAVVTQGGSQSRGFVSRYRLAYSKDGVHFQNYTRAGSSVVAALQAQVQPLPACSGSSIPRQCQPVPSSGVSLTVLSPKGTDLDLSGPPLSPVVLLRECGAIEDGWTSQIFSPLV